MSAGSVVYFLNPSKPASSPKKKPKDKATVLEWIRNGYAFPGKPAPEPKHGKGGRQ